MGHPSSQPLTHLPDIVIRPPAQNKICDICCLAKHTRSVFPTSFSRSLGIFYLIQVDIWGPYRVSTVSSAKYFLTIGDDFSRAVWVFLMHDKG